MLTRFVLLRNRVLSKKVNRNMLENALFSIDVSTGYPIVSAASYFCVEISIFYSVIFDGGGAKFGFAPLPTDTLATILRFKLLVFERCAIIKSLINQALPPVHHEKIKEWRKVIFPKTT